MLSDQGNIALKIIFLLPAVRPLPAGPVKPDAEQFAVPCQKLLQLIAIVIITFP